MLNFTRGSPFPPSPGRRGRGAPSPVGYPPEQVTPQGLHDFGQRSTQNLRLEEPSVEKPLPAAPVSVTVASITLWTGRPASSALCPGLCGHAVQCVLTPVEPPSCRNLPSPSLATWPGRAPVAAQRTCRRRPHWLPRHHPRHVSPGTSSPRCGCDFSPPTPRRRTTRLEHRCCTCSYPPRLDLFPRHLERRGRVGPHAQDPPPAGSRPQTHRPSPLAFPLRDETCSALVLAESLIGAGARAAQAPHATAGEEQPRAHAAAARRWQGMHALPATTRPARPTAASLPCSQRPGGAFCAESLPLSRPFPPRPPR